MKLHKNLRFASVAGATLMLAACGGGSNNPQPLPIPTPTGFSVVGKGTAGKGIVIGAAAEAFEVTANGLVSRGTTVTQSDGNFVLSLTRYTGNPLLFQIKGGGSAVMKCDVRAGCRDAANNPVAFGGRFALGSSFVMEGISDGVSESEAANGLTACVSPLTHLAASRARELAGGTAEKITAANASRAITEVRLLTGGVDSGSLCVIDLTDPAKVDAATPEQLAHSLFSAAVLAVTAGLDPAQALANLSAAFQGGRIAATDSDSSRVSLGDLVAAAKNEAARGEIPLPANIQVADMNVQQASSNGNTVQPCPSDNCGGSPAQASAAEKARAVFGELRSLYHNTEEEITDPAKAFGDQLQAAQMASEPGSRLLGDGLGKGVSEAFRFYTRGNMAAGSTTLTTTNAARVSKSATITVRNNADGSDEIALKGDVRDSALDVLMKLPHSVNGTGTLKASIVGTAQSAGSSGVKLNLTQAAVTLVVALDGEGDSLPDELTVNGQAVYAQFGVSNPVSIEGKLELDVLRCTGCGSNNQELHYNPRLVALSGKVSNSGNNASTSARFDVDGASARKFNPGKDYGASNFVKGSVSVSAALSLSGSAPYSAVIALNSTGFDTAKNEATGNFNVKLARGDKFYDIVVPLSLPPDLSADKLKNKTVSLTITTADNVVIAVNDIPTNDDKPITGSVVVAGEQAATISETSSGLVLIRYKDGVVESLY